MKVNGWQKSNFLNDMQTNITSITLHQKSITVIKIQPWTGG